MSHPPENGTTSRILLIEDEELIARTIELNLRAQGFDVIWEKTGDSGLQRARSESWDLIVLDVMLPGINGFEIASILRRSDGTTPILMLTALGDTENKVRGLEGGADDYLTKPFEMAELTVRAKALIRRATGSRHVPSSRVVRFGGRYEVNLDTLEAMTNEGQQKLTEKEASLMNLFFRERGKTLGRPDILEEVWGMNHFPTERTVDNVVVKLRRYFEPNPQNPQYIVSVRGLGYRFAG